MHTDSVALDEVVQGRVSGRQNTRDRLETTEDGEPSETENAVWREELLQVLQDSVSGTLGANQWLKIKT